MEGRAETEFVAMFLALPPVGKAEVVASLIHWETIRAREAYLEWDGPIDGQLLRRSNEHVHRLAGYINVILREGTSQDRDASFIGMVVEVAAKRGQQELKQLEAWLRSAQAFYRRA